MPAEVIIRRRARMPSAEFDRLAEISRKGRRRHASVREIRRHSHTHEIAITGPMSGVDALDSTRHVSHAGQQRRRVGAATPATNIAHAAE